MQADVHIGCSHYRYSYYLCIWYKLIVMYKNFSHLNSSVGRTFDYHAKRSCPQRSVLFFWSPYSPSSEWIARSPETLKGRVLSKGQQAIVSCPSGQKHRRSIRQYISTERPKLLGQRFSRFIQMFLYRITLILSMKHVLSNFLNKFCFNVETQMQNSAFVKINSSYFFQPFTGFTVPDIKFLYRSTLIVAP